MKSPATLSLETPGAQLVLALRSGVWTFARLGARCGAAEDIAALASARPYAANHCAEGPMETYPAFGSSRGQGHRRLGNTRGANDGRLAPLRLSGLDPSLDYRIREINLPRPGTGLHTAFSGKTLRGGALVSAGLPFDLGPGDDSFVLELTATKQQGTHT